MTMYYSRLTKETISREELVELYEDMRKNDEDLGRYFPTFEDWITNNNIFTEEEKRMSCESLEVFFVSGHWNGEPILLLDSDGWEIGTFETWEDIEDRRPDLMEADVLDAQLLEDYSTGKSYWDIMLGVEE